MLKGKGVGMRGDGSSIPVALQLLEEHWNGKTVEQLSRETGIPSDRVEMRLNAAEVYLQQLSESEGTGTTVSEKRGYYNIRLGVETAYG